MTGRTAVTKQTLRFALDSAMIVLLVCGWAYRITGDTAHKVIGIGIFVLFSAHIFVNRRWFPRIFKGVYTPYRMLTTAVNAALTAAAATVIITGALEAVRPPSFLFIESGITAREIHTAAAYWLLPLTGIHLGFHWGMVSRFMRKNSLIIAVTRIAAFPCAAFGAWSFVDRDMFAKLFRGFSFDYWPVERPAVLFFAETLSILCIFVFTAYYCIRLVNRLKNRRLKP